MLWVLISREIAAKSGREVALASVYAARAAQKKRFVVATLGEQRRAGGRARNLFQPTAAGLREARDAHDTLLRFRRPAGV